MLRANQPGVGAAASVKSNRQKRERTHVKIRRVSFDADFQVSALYVDRKIFCSHTSRNRHVYVHFSEGLIPLVDHATVMRELVSLAWRKSFSAHRLWADLRGPNSSQSAKFRSTAPTTFEVVLLWIWIPLLCC